MLETRNKYLAYVNERQRVGRTSTNFWHTVLRPFRFLLRITEYLAGPPVYEEITALQQEAENWRSYAADLESERYELQNAVEKLQIQRDRSARDAKVLTKQREELKQKITALEKTTRQLEEHRIQIERERAQPTSQLQANSDISSVELNALSETTTTAG